MIDSNMLQQLKGVFAKLEGKVKLVYHETSHAKQTELLDMLKSVASTSEKITVESSGHSDSVPKFHIEHNERKNGISFVGIPGGHEFTSLILAILNSDKKGKLPDQGLINRVMNIKGPIKVRTFISLSCENCPEVVQALNIMAIFHPQFEHEMVDGSFVEEEAKTLKIQGVPSVMAESELVSSGKVSLLDLISRLEKKFGKNSSDASSAERDLGEYDVVIVGGGPAGASSAIYSARKGLKTGLIAERIGGQLQDTKSIENLISIPFTEGPELSANLVKHMSDYEIEILEHRRVKEVQNGELKKLLLESGESLTTKSLIVATGAKWRELKVPGEKEYLGRGVAFCPHCDGPYYKGKDIAVIGGGNSGVEAAIDLAGIVRSVVVVEFNDELKADQVLVDKLNSLSNTSVVINAKTTEIVGDGEKVSGFIYEDRKTSELKTVKLDGVFVQIGLLPNSGFIKDIVEVNRYGEIIVDDKCKTNIKGVYAAGDVTTTPFKQIVVAMGEGAKAALSAFEDQMIA